MSDVSSSLRLADLLGDLGSAFRSMPDAEAAALLLEHYRIQASLRRLDTEKDDTFLAETGDGARFILKIANPAESADEIGAQIALLDFLRSGTADLPTPRVLADSRACPAPVFTDRAGQKRQMRLMTFLDGVPLDRVPSSPAQRAHTGMVLARLRLALAGFDHPGCHRVVPWDVRRLDMIAPLLAHVNDPARHRALQAGLHRLQALRARIAGLRRQVVHNDFSRSNIIVDPDHPDAVTGVIDFGDAVHTAVAIDVSTAVLNQLPEQVGGRHAQDLFADARDLMLGYLRIADLTAEEIALIPHLTMGRIIARALITLWRAERFPHNARYILRNTDRGWDQLDWLLARDPDRISAQFAASLAAA